MGVSRSHVSGSSSLGLNHGKTRHRINTVDVHDVHMCSSNCCAIDLMPIRADTSTLQGACDWHLQAVPGTKQASSEHCWHG